MAERKPLVVIDGTVREIPAGDTVAGVQPALVSGTNIKTVNGQSVLGSGNVTTDQITVSTTAPASPTLNQLWLDIS